MPLEVQISMFLIIEIKSFQLVMRRILNRFGHPYIYNVLDWSSSDPTKNAVTVVGTLLLSLAIHIVLFGVFRLRVFIHRKCVRTNKDASLSTTAAIAASNSRISMVLGCYEYNNNGFSGSTEKI